MTKAKKAEVNIKIPKRVLNSWLKKNMTWDHEDWLRLLELLKNKGHGDLIKTKQGKEQIGIYLEKNRQ